MHALFAYRDFLLRSTVKLTAPDSRIVTSWQKRLANGEALGEQHALAILSDFGVATTSPHAAADEEAVLAAANRCGYPVVLKTAKQGLLHKSDQGGVVVGIADEEQLRRIVRADEAAGSATTCWYRRSPMPVSK